MTLENKTKEGVATQKAFLVSVFFLALGIFGWIHIVVPAPRASSLPLFIFYLIIVVNTFFSVKTFVQITPRESVAQKIYDATLVVLYATMALSMNDPFRFVFFDILLFVVATIKYALLSQIAPYPKLIRRKILVDLSGVILGLLTLIGIVEGYELASVWAFTDIFIIANILLFFVWPLYHLRHDQ